MNNHSKIQMQKSECRKLVVIAASAGGIDALAQILSRLPMNIHAAVIVVQHMRGDRPTQLPVYLDRLCPLRVCLAEHGMFLEPGVVYIAEPGKHMRIENDEIVLDTGRKLNFVRPSADILFSSAAQAFGPDAIGIILSGTGKDGTLGCKEIKAKGGVTIAQDEKSSMHFGMARAALEENAIDYVIPLMDIAGKIIELLCEN